MAPTHKLPAKPPSGPNSMIIKPPSCYTKREKRKQKAMDNLVALFDSGKIDLAPKVKEEDKKPEDSGVASLPARPNVGPSKGECRKLKTQRLPYHPIVRHHECGVCHETYLNNGKTGHPPKKTPMGICFDCEIAGSTLKACRGKCIRFPSHRLVRFCLVCGHSVCQPRYGQSVAYCACIADLLPHRWPRQLKREVLAEQAQIEQATAYQVCLELQVAEPDELPTYKSVFKLQTTPLPGISSGALFMQEKRKTIMKQVLEESRSGMNMPKEEDCAMQFSLLELNSPAKLK